MHPYLKQKSDRVRSAVPGERTNVLRRAAFKLGLLVGAGQFSRDDAAVELELVARECGLTEGVQATIENGLEAGIAKAPF